MECIGLIPSSGTAHRLGRMAGSKELMPMGYDSQKSVGSLKVVSTYLLEKYRNAGVKKVFTIIRKGKWDIPNYFGDGREEGVQMAYLIMSYPFGVPYTLDQAYAFVSSTKIFLGFPDILFEPENAFRLADDSLERNKADAILGLYPVVDERLMKSCDMVQLGENNQIDRIFVKKKATNCNYSWVFTVWKPEFTEFMHAFLKREFIERQKNNIQTEIHLGHIFQSAIQNGLRVLGHIFDNHRFIDIGIPENIPQAIKAYYIDKV